MVAALGLFVVLEVVGLLAAPLTALIFTRLPGAGLGFSKVFGLLLITWVIWMAASLHVAPYSRGLIIGVLALLAVAGMLVALRLRSLGARASGSTRKRLKTLALPEDSVRRRLFWGAETIFAVVYVIGSLFASYAPDVWGTEKPMDMGFITAINGSTHFPPHDPWMSGESLNYYYFGHLVLAWPVKLLGLRPDGAYLLLWGALMALTATAVYTLAGTLWAAARATFERPPRGGPVFAGLVAAALLTVLGNLAGVRSWVKATDPPKDYAWFDPSRVIPNTINEFPSFSFTLGDLHAHVIALPFSVLAIAFAMQIVFAGPRGDLLWRGVAEALAAGLALGAMYAMNSWSYPVCAGLLAAAVVMRVRTDGRVRYLVVWLGLVLVASFALILPFVLNFQPEARGIGVVAASCDPVTACAPRRPFGRWLGDMALIYGILLWPLVGLYVRRLLDSPNRWRWLGWGVAAGLVLGSLLASSNLTGAGLLAVATVVGISAALAPELSAPLRFLWLLVAGGMALLLIPELVYLRDAFDNGALERMNTVFKAGYQGYLLLGLAAGCALPWAAVWLPRRAWPVWAGVASVLLVLGLVYPYAGGYARTGGYANAPTLDGLKWLRSRSPGDPGAIAWLRDHTGGDAVVLEAVGDDYSAFGHGRISTFSGRPTVMGWQGHEVQWQHDPGSRAADVQKLYTIPDAAAARALIAKYGIDYVVSGPIERTTYGDAGAGKWDGLGKRVYSSQGTTVWAIS